MNIKLTIRLLVLFLLVSFIVGGGLLWWRDATSAVDPQNSTNKIFVISSGEAIRSVATRLKSENLIKDQIGFFLLTKLLKLDGKIQAGDFRLNPSMSAYTIAEELTHGSLDVWVTLLEGWRNEEIALKLAQSLAIPEQEFLSSSKEGYMFPDTYLIPRDASAAAVVTLFQDNFESKVTPEIRQAIESQGLRFSQGIVLASIVEREGKSNTDRPIIAGILLSRLKKNYPLQTDATLQYALGYQSGSKSWWKKKELFNEDKTIDSPYNTYANSGLPPAPISNPGLESIQAVAYPQLTDYFYYIHDPSGVAHYAETLDEHNANVARYLE